MSETRTKLVIWGKSSADGEYLAADILRMEKYTQIDPVHPQGGPDGTKDIICFSGIDKYIAACYFPNNSNEIDFNKVETKFDHDYKGVSKNNGNGFVFFTNVHITSGERGLLEQKGSNIKIYHLERIRGVLDTPLGYGLRLKVLNIPMSQEEQLSFFEAVRTQHLDTINENIYKILDSNEKLSGDIKNLMSQVKDFIGNKE